jgi:outer membrane protein assembly factor BamA
LGWLELELRYDTRDSQRMPYRGFAVGAEIDSALLQTGWDLGSVFTAYGTVIFPLPPLLHGGGDPEEENPPTDTFAFQLKTSTTAGDLPFYSLPTLGGSRTLRGFVAGRFRDRSMWHASAEYRFWVLTRGFPIPFTKALRVERVGLAFFGDTGSVADDWPDLFSSRVWASAGVGLRVTLERDAPFRVDVGFSTEGVEVTAGFGLSF